MSNAELTFATYYDLPTLDADDVLVARELEQLGVRVQAAIWDDPSVDWSRTGTCIVRSTWDYHTKYDQFQEWLSQVSTRAQLWNPAEIILWNSRKTYLRDLAAKGVPIVPTAWLSPGQSVDLGSMLEHHGWYHMVIKPTVGLATHGVHKLNLAEAPAPAMRERLARATEHTEKLLETSAVMVQPFLPSVQDYGERALVFMAGQYSHAVRKVAFQELKPAGHAGELLVEATAEELSVAAATLAAAPPGWLYARVDLVRDFDNRPVVMELEMVEPSLYFAHCPGSARVFAEVLAAMLKDPAAKPADVQSHAVAAYRTPPAPVHV